MSKASWQPAVPVDTLPLALCAGSGPVLRFPQFLGDGTATAGCAQMGDHITLYGVELGANPKPATVERSREFNASVVVGRMKMQRRVFLVADDRVVRHSGCPLPQGRR